MLKRTTKVILCFYFSVAACITFASSHNNHNSRPRGFHNDLNTIAKIQQYGRDDDYVQLKGRLTSYLGEDKYEFTDLLGLTIEVELDDDFDWSRFSKNESIEIYGELDKDFFSLKIKCEGAVSLAPKEENIDSDINTVVANESDN